MTTETVIAELRAWERETGLTLPRAAHEIAWLEMTGAVVDLVTGEMFRPADRWGDFAVRWSEEQERLGRDTAQARLAEVVARANGNRLGKGMCAAIATETLALVGA